MLQSYFLLHSRQLGSRGRFKVQHIVTVEVLKLSGSVFRKIVNMGRKFWVGGNWKMNGDKKSIDDIIAFLKKGPLDPNVGK